MTRSLPPTRSRCSSRTCGASSRPTASRAFCTPSEERATSFARRVVRILKRAVAPAYASFDRLPIRVRLASVSALLTFVILCAFAVAIGSFTVHRVRADFNHQVDSTALQLSSQLRIIAEPTGLHRIVSIEPPLAAFTGGANRAEIRILTLLGGRVIVKEPADGPPLGEPNSQPTTIHGYRVVSHAGVVRAAGSDDLLGQVIIQYGRRISDTEATVARVEL